MQTKVIYRKGGSLRVENEEGIIVVDENGNVIKEAPGLSFCRCGLSAKMPFCDGAHKTAEFEKA